MSAAMEGEEQTVEGFEQVPGTDASAAGNDVQEVQPDLRERVMMGGDFAWEQIQKRDAHSSKLANQVKDLEPVQQLVDFAGGTDRLIQFADLGSRVQQIPGLMDVVQSAISTGRVELPAAPQATQDAPEEEEWMDPDTRKVRDTLTARLDELNSKLASLEGVAAGADLRSKEQRVQENINKALSQFEGVPEAFEEASKLIGEKYKQAYAAAERGDSVQAQLVDQLASPDGVGVLDFVTMPIYKRHAARLVAAESNDTPEAAALARKSTDAPTVNPSRPGAPPMPARPKGRVRDDYVQRVLEEAARRKGVDPRVL